MDSDPNIPTLKAQDISNTNAIRNGTSEYLKF